MYPDDLTYTAEHEWVKLVGDGDGAVLRLGITSYAQEALGDIVFVQLPALGAQLDAGASLGEVESTKSVSDVYAPVAGTVAGRNDQLDASPELVNSDPYGDGWMVELSTPGGAAQALADGVAAGTFLDAAAYQALVAG